MKKLLVILLSLTLPGCAGTPPAMPYKPKSFIGSSSEQALCRLIKLPYTPVDNLCFYYKPHNDDFDKECIKSECAEFTNYTCYSHVDNKMIKDYITTLITSCKKWK